MYTGCEAVLDAVVGVCVEAVQCHMPANGESVTISTVPTVPVDVSLSLLKRTMSDTSELHNLFSFFSDKLVIITVDVFLNL